MSKVIQYDADTCIIGAGIAGIAAAIELLDRNHKVILIDRDRQENFGGLAKESFGGMFMVNTPEQRRGGIKDTPDLALSDWLATAEFDQQDHLPKAWAKMYTEESLENIYHWLKPKGVRFFPVVHWVERGLYSPGNSVPRFHMVWGTGHGLIATLIQQLISHPRASNLKIIFEHAVTKLEYTNSKVVGCSGTTENKPETKMHFNVQADNTIIAAGGINGNMKLVRENWSNDWSQPPKIILNGSHHFADGTLHKAASELGANITHLDKMWNYAAGVRHPHPRRPNHGLSLVPCPSALWVNAKGHRIGPEPMVTGFDTRRLVTQTCQQPGQFSWQILNKKIALKELAVSGAEYNDALRDKKLFSFLKTLFTGNTQLINNLEKADLDLVTGQTLDELADKMNTKNKEISEDLYVDNETLMTQIHSYDEQVRKGKNFHNDDQLRRIRHLRQYRGNRVRTCKFQPIIDNKHLPLIAIRCFVLSRKSLGGIQTNLQSQVVKASGEIIEGLYAIGESSGFGGGGLHGKRTLEGTFLGGSILTAQKAVENIHPK